jgi:4-aminobutyrate aminotransferase-like enzyme
MPSSLTSQEVSALTRKLNYGTWRFQKSWNPLHVVDAEGCYFVDATGKRYLDFSAQLMCVNLGHKNAAVIQSIEEQARALPYIYSGAAWATSQVPPQYRPRVAPPPGRETSAEALLQANPAGSALSAPAARK